VLDRHRNGPDAGRGIRKNSEPGEPATQRRDQAVWRQSACPWGETI